MEVERRFPGAVATDTQDPRWPAFLNSINDPTTNAPFVFTARTAISRGDADALVRVFQSFAQHTMSGRGIAFDGGRLGGMKPARAVAPAPQQDPRQRIIPWSEVQRFQTEYVKHVARMSPTERDRSAKQMEMYEQAIAEGRINMAA